ncbi:retropepsin-like aspartic protease family protein [Sphingomonas arenae]|uniref:retropepsin-like aspartic protease family protein n=1 Tax=Sphingomonas arenae TaxID=2812555 RepID=UPI0019670338|nr:TIGR02281 family clan AA aspartic protease [Sphingomonas arenae]
MWRGIVIILFVATFVGAMMPSRHVAPEDGGANTSTAPDDWGSGEPEVTSASPSYSSRTASSSSDGTSTSGGTVRLTRRPDGHFYANAKVNGRAIEFLVDTGASGIALSYRDAQRAGIEVNRANFYTVGEGASGPVRGQVVRMDEVKLGHETATGVSGIVMDGGTQSLLGQSFLERFGSVEIRGDTMTLR